MKQFFLYAICGGTGVLTDFAIYYLVVELGLWYQGANILGYFGGTLISFFLNRLITFKVKDQPLKRLFAFLGVASLGFLASAGMLFVFVDLLSFDPKISKLLSLPVVVIIQFLINRKFTFGKI